MDDWTSRIETALEAAVPGPAGRGIPPLALAAVRGTAASHLLARGIVLTTLLGRCALAEAEGDCAGDEYRRELAEAAAAIVADWQALARLCARAGVAHEQVVGEAGESHMARGVVQLAQRIVAG